MSGSYKRRELERFLKFLTVGILGAIVDFGVMNLLTHLLQLELVPAGTISFVCAVCSNFIWNRYWTYPDSRSRPLMQQLGMFFLVNSAGAAIRIPILWGLEPHFLRLFENFHTTLPLDTELLAKNGTLAVAVLIVLLWNFFINRYWTYNDVDKFRSEGNHGK